MGAMRDLAVLFLHLLATVNGHRPHRALQLNPLERRRPPIASATACSATRVQRRDRLGGVVHEYARAAWWSICTLQEWEVVSDTTEFAGAAWGLSRPKRPPVQQPCPTPAAPDGANNLATPNL